MKMISRFSGNIRNGNVPSTRMKKSLLSYLGLQYRFYNYFFVAILCIIFILLGIFFINKNIIVFIIYLFLLLGLVVLYFVLLDKRRIKYIADIAYYYETYFKEYQDMKRIFTYHILGIDEIKKESVLFFSDGYYFYIFEDCLLSTHIPLKGNFKTNYNSMPLLKIYDAEAVDHKPFTFKLGEVISYTLVGKYKKEPEHEIEEEYCHVFAKQEFSNYLAITLSDFRILKLGVNVYPFFQEILPLKEV